MCEKCVEKLSNIQFPDYKSTSEDINTVICFDKLDKMLDEIAPMKCV